MFLSDNGHRYVLIQTLADGAPKALKPVPNLSAGEQIIRDLIARGEDGWYLFDAKESRSVWPRDARQGSKNPK